MEIPEYINKKKKIQISILEFIECDDDVEEKFNNFLKIIKDQNILQNRSEIKSLLTLLVKISDNHYRSPNFFEKIEKILNFLQQTIQKNFTNREIFHLFHTNKRILLFLIENKIIKIDDFIIDSLENLNNYFLEFFYPEIKNYINDELRSEIENDVKELKNIEINEFNKKRKKGENDQYICQLIRDDSIDEFISFVNQNCIPLSSEIESSLFETNSLLGKNEVELIEYSAFYGSIQIFKYLNLNGCKLSFNLCPFIIHGQHPEIIQIFIDFWNNLDENNANDIFGESLRFHHNEVTNYVLNNFCKNVDLNDDVYYSRSLKYYNYTYFPDKFDNETIFFYLCKYDYYDIVEILLKTVNLDINKIMIFKLFLNQVYF